MVGTIELHGAKQVLVEEGNNTIISSTIFIPGDTVIIKNGKPVLVERRPQAVIGIVEKLESNNAFLHVPNFGQTSHFKPSIINDNLYYIGERLVLWLGSDGNISIKGRYPADAVYDSLVLVHMYSLTERNAGNEWQQFDNLYTKQEVIDHEDLDTFTIDPASSVDFDDALSVDVKNNTVYIHIVDIAGQKISEIGEQFLQERCLTLYLSNERTEHLLEEEEASNTLSLVAGKPRKVITVRVTLDQAGLVLNYDIYRSIISVKKRWNYDEVSDIMTTNEAPASFRFLADLTEKRSADVKYNLNLPSVRVSCSSDGSVRSLTTENTNDVSHSMVATAMILANLTVSVHIRIKGKELPNRFHDTLRGFKAPDFVKTGNEHVDSFILVKRYSRAYYSVDERGHFGLGVNDYVHFTSPMRRYADVIVHRILAGRIPANMEEEVKWLNHRSSVVRAAQDIYTNWKVIRWLQANEKRHSIWVTGVSKSGIMWFMPSNSLNGFIHVSGLKPTQYWKYDEGSSYLKGQADGAEIWVGQKLDVDIVSIDSIKGTVSLKIV